MWPLMRGALRTPAVNAPGVVSGSGVVEEFVGPFSSWLNVKTGYGAVGNGSTDDTTAFQNALNALDASNPVLWIPAGTYKITSTISLAAAINISIIGADPATTTIQWFGSTSTAMLLLNGVAYSRINRLTWDGRSVAGVICIDQNYDGSGNYFDTGNEYADNVFQDALIGIRGGYSDHGFAETSVWRNRFYRCSAGITLGNFNALDSFVWYSRFEDCVVGVTNTWDGLGAGNFNVYNSVFKRSTVADIYIGNTGSFSFRDNYSIDSEKFLFAGATGNTGSITLQGNTILDPLASEPTPKPVIVANLGPLFMIDNTIRSLSSVTSQVVVTAGVSGKGELFSIGNKFTSSNPYGTPDARYHSINDTTVTRASITTAEPTLPGTPPNLGRTIHDISPGSNTATIQGVIDAAVSGGSRHVVHVPPGTLNITSGLTIPTGSDIQLIGDGAASIISWNSGSAGTMLALASPARAVLRDFRLTGAGVAGYGITVAGCDQNGARVYMDQPYLTNYTKNLVVNALDYTQVLLTNFYHSGYGGPVVTDPSVEVIGGSSAAAGSWLGGKTVLYSGASSDGVVLYHLSSGGHLHTKDLWYESGSFSKFIVLTGPSVFSLSGFRIAVTTSPGPAIDVNAFTGSMVVLGTAIDGDVTLHGSSSGGKALLIGFVSLTDDFYTDTTSPALTSLVLNTQSRESPAGGFSADPLSEVGSYDTSFITTALAEVRNLAYVNLDNKTAGLTDVRLYRVQVGQALVGIQLN